MRGPSLLYIALIFSLLSCKKETPNQSQNTGQGTPPTVYPCPAPTFTNIINPNGTKLVKTYGISNGGDFRSTSFFYYDSFTRLVGIKSWDTIKMGVNVTYNCSETYFVYNAGGKVSKRISFQSGNASPVDSMIYFYDAVPKLVTEVRTQFPWTGGGDTSKYIYYPGKIEYNYPSGQNVYFVNATNNLDSIHSQFLGNLVYSYDGKVNPQKDFRSRWGAFNADQNVVNIMDSQFNVLSTYSYTYNANNLPLVASRTGEITYYFYE